VVHCTNDAAVAAVADGNGDDGNFFDRKEDDDDDDKGLEEEEEEEISVVEPTTTGRGDRLAPWPIRLANEDGRQDDEDDNEGRVEDSLAAAPRSSSSTAVVVVASEEEAEGRQGDSDVRIEEDNCVPQLSLLLRVAKEAGRFIDDSEGLTGDNCVPLLLSSLIAAGVTSKDGQPDGDSDGRIRDSLVPLLSSTCGRHGNRESRNDDDDNAPLAILCEENDLRRQGDGDAEVRLGLFFRLCRRGDRVCTSCDGLLLSSGSSLLRRSVS